jgi:Flp pilus assembly protein TadD
MRILVSQGTSSYRLEHPTDNASPETETHESKVLFNQALEKMSRNRVGEAMSKLEEALQISPNNALYLSHYGLCVAMEREDFISAVRLCEHAVKLNPRNPVCRVNLGKVHRLNGCNAEAYEEFIGAWKADQSHPAPAAELSRMGIRRPPVLRFLPRSHWLNVRLGLLRARVERALGAHR